MYESTTKCQTILGQWAGVLTYRCTASTQNSLATGGVAECLHGCNGRLLYGGALRGCWLPSWSGWHIDWFDTCFCSGDYQRATRLMACMPLLRMYMKKDTVQKRWFWELDSNSSFNQSGWRMITSLDARRQSYLHQLEVNDQVMRVDRSQRLVQWVIRATRLSIRVGGEW